jgi:hypothetical protein
MPGLYETAIDWLASHPPGGSAICTIRPKVVASTATVRRAERRFARCSARAHTEVFPPPGPDRRDSFFARTVPATEVPARRYLGHRRAGAQLEGRAAANLPRAAVRRAEALPGRGRHRASPNPADPYMTLLGYFNSLRELGGSRRIVEDEVGRRSRYSGRRDPTRGRGCVCRSGDRHGSLSS